MAEISVSEITSTSTIKQQHPDPRRFPVSIMIIVSITFAFVGSVCVDTLRGMDKIDQISKNTVKTCLIDFVKANCNAATPSDTCRPLM